MFKSCCNPQAPSSSPKKGHIIPKLGAAWAIVTFVPTFLLVLIPTLITYLIPGKKGQQIFNNLAKLWMNCWLPLVGCRVNIIGAEHVKRTETHIIACNHNSFLDAAITCPYIPNGNRTIAKKSIAKVPLFGWFYARGTILIDRKNAASRKLGFEKMKSTLEEDINVCIYPEGTRNTTAQHLNPFQDGAFLLSVVSQKPIVPTIITGTRCIMPAKHFFYFKPHPITIQFLPPIYPTNVSAKQLKQQVYEAMLLALQQQTA